MPELKLIIFDVDGTLADTERYGHLPASNEAVRLLGLDFQWDWNEFRELMPIPGNANRFRFTLERRGFQPDKIEPLVRKFESLKKRLYIEKYLPALELRKGVKELIGEIISANLRLAIVSTSYEAQIRALLDSKLPDVARRFEVVLGKESGLKTGKEGFLYQKCLTVMNCTPEEALAVEDSQEGLEAAVSVGIPTVVFYNDYTFGSGFEKAKLVAPGADFVDLELLKKVWAFRFSE